MSPEDAIDRILELSAEAQTRRRGAPENSSAFHKLTGAVLAYGQALDPSHKTSQGALLEARQPGSPGHRTRLFLSPFNFLSAVPGIALGLRVPGVDFSALTPRARIPWLPNPCTHTQ